jgi:hypothetical protein
MEGVEGGTFIAREGMLYGGNRCVTVLAKGKGGRFLESCYEDRGSDYCLTFAKRRAKLNSAKLVRLANEIVSWE